MVPLCCIPPPISYFTLLLFWAFGAHLRRVRVTTSSWAIKGSFLKLSVGFIIFYAKQAHGQICSEPVTNILNVWNLVKHSKTPSMACPRTLLLRNLAPLVLEQICKSFIFKSNVSWLSKVISVFGDDTLWYIHEFNKYYGHLKKHLGFFCFRGRVLPWLWLTETTQILHVWIAG